MTKIDHEPAWRPSSVEGLNYPHIALPLENELDWPAPMWGLTNLQAGITKEMEKTTIGAMAAGEAGYAVPWAMYADHAGRLWLKGDYGIDQEAFGTASMMVKRLEDGGGYTVDISKCDKFDGWRKGTTYRRGHNDFPVQVVYGRPEWITIPIWQGAPVRINTADWPVIARGTAGRRLSATICSGAAIILRQHADGRTIAEAAYVLDGCDDIVVGRMGNGKDDMPSDIFLVATCLTTAVGRESQVIKQAEARAFASLPLVTLE